METTTINALFRYFEELYCLNQNILALCGANAFDLLLHQEQAKRIDGAMITIPRLIPYKYVKKSNSWELLNTDGLMIFSEDIPFLKERYESIFESHKDFLIKAKKIRNKLEHAINNAEIMETASSPSSFFDITYEVDKIRITVTASEILSFLKDLNNLFSEMQAEVVQYAWEHQKNGNRYYERLTQYDFCNFNKIYESDMVRIIGKAMLPF